MSSDSQSSADPFNPRARPKKAPPPLLSSFVKSPPPKIIVVVCRCHRCNRVQCPPAVVKKAPPPSLPFVKPKPPPPTLPGKQPPPTLADSIRTQAPPAVVKRAPPLRSNHKPKSVENVNVEADYGQLAPPLRALPREAPALKAPPPKLSSETNIKTSN